MYCFLFRAAAAAIQKRMESIETVEAIMEHILNSVLQMVSQSGLGQKEEEESCKQIDKLEDVDRLANGLEVKTNKAPDEAVIDDVANDQKGTSSVQQELACDVERELDKEARLQILLNLFQLACSMVYTC